MKLILLTSTILFSQINARGSDYAYDKPKRYPARCLTDEILNSTQEGINKDDCLRRQQKCNMKTGTIEAKQTACQQLAEMYPELTKETHINQEKLALHNEKVALRESVKSEKKQLRETKQNDRLNKKSSNHKFMKRCADWKPNTDNPNANQNKFETCNELIRLSQDIKKFCILTAESIDPSFEYDKLRKKRSIEMVDDAMNQDENILEDNLDEIIEEDIQEIEQEIENDTNVENTEESTENDEPFKSQRKIPKMHSFHQSKAKTHEPKQTTQRKNAKQHLQSCESKRFLQWFEDHKDDDDVWFNQIDQILKDAQEAKDDELSRR